MESTADTLSPATHALMRAVIDYAGLFPPAQLGMAETVRNYLRYRGGERCWMLGRMVVPAARLCEFAEATRMLGGNHGPISVSALAVTAADASELASFEAMFGSLATIDCVETRAENTQHIEEVVRRFTRGSRSVFVEVPLNEQLDANLKSVQSAGARAKVRTGSVHPDQCVQTIPLARFLVAAAQFRLPFKATAGLHHARPGVRPLTYEADSQCGHMQGFLNVFGAAALLWHGRLSTVEQVAAMLDSSEVKVSNEELTWQEHRVTTDEITSARSEFAIAFGSCSFTEPEQELAEEGLI